MEQPTPAPQAAAAFRELAEAMAGPVRNSVQEFARAFAGWPTDRQQPRRKDPSLSSPKHVTARRRAANKRARATRQAQRRG